MVLILKNSKMKNGFQVVPCFSIGLHKKDQAILEEIKVYLQCIGNITRQTKDAVLYRVTSKKDLAVIINHFDSYPLITQKRADYELFKQAFELVDRKEHLTPEGFHKILAIRASINNGLSEELKVAFPDITPILKPTISVPETIDPEWLAGFVSGEGCFYVVTSESRSEGLIVRLRFILSQDSRDEQLMKSLITYFGCGRCEKAKDGMVYFRVTNFADNYEKIIPFFSKHQIAGIKTKDFDDWCKIAAIVKTKAHLTKEGSDQIIKIKAQMNKGRENGL